MTNSTFNFPTRIVYGDEALASIPLELSTKNLNKPFVVLDKNIESSIFFKDLISSLEKKFIQPTLYHDIQPNPVKKNVDNAIQIYKTKDCDSLIIIGGGSVLDVGKAIALMVTNEGDLFDYEDGLDDARTAKNQLPFRIAIPTTCGTGSEVGRSSVISDDVSHQKKIIFSPLMMPDLVLLDPNTILSLPDKILAATSLDALTHCIEAYLAKGFHPICDGIALEGIRILFEYIPKAYKNPKDLEAKSQLLLASCMGAIAFQKGLGVTHSLAHALSTIYDTHHGLANGILLPYCLSYNKIQCEAKYEKISFYLKNNLNQPSEKNFIDEIVYLREFLKIPNTLEKLNIEISKELIDIAFLDGCHYSNPRKVTISDIEQILNNAKTGSYSWK